jgi:hypothetical protein
MNRLDKVLEQAKAVVQLLEQIAEEQERLAAESRQLLFRDEKELPRRGTGGKLCPYHHTLCRCAECMACGCDHHKLWLQPAREGKETELQPTEPPLRKLWDSRYMRSGVLPPFFRPRS